MNANDMKRLAPASDAASRSRQAAARLRELAADRHLLDVAIATVSSPIGDLLIAVTERGLVRVAFQGEDRDNVLEELSRRLSPRILESARASDEVRSELDQYFAGERTRFDVTVDRRLIGDFARKVLGATARVPFGRTTTYGEVATKIGRASCRERV